MAKGSSSDKGRVTRREVLKGMVRVGVVVTVYEDATTPDTNLKTKKGSGTNGAA